MKNIHKHKLSTQAEPQTEINFSNRKLHKIFTTLWWRHYKWRHRKNCSTSPCNALFHGITNHQRSSAD